MREGIGGGNWLGPRRILFEPLQHHVFDTKGKLNVSQSGSSADPSSAQSIISLVPAARVLSKTEEWVFGGVNSINALSEICLQSVDTEGLGISRIDRGPFPRLSLRGPRSSTVGTGGAAPLQGFSRMRVLLAAMVFLAHSSGYKSPTGAKEDIRRCHPT